MSAALELIRAVEASGGIVTGNWMQCLVGATELLRGCRHGPPSRKLIPKTAPPKSKCPRGPPLLEPDTMHTKSRSVLKIRKKI